MGKAPEPKWEYRYVRGIPEEGLLTELTRSSTFDWEPVFYFVSKDDAQDPVLNVLMRRSWAEHNA